MKYLSLFSGIGGFELGIEQAYEKTKGSGLARERECDCCPQRGQEEVNVRGVGVPQDNGNMHNDLCSQTTEDNLQCVGFSEIDKYAASIYQRHFPNHTAYGDITKIDERCLPDFDLLVGGFPCQAFSIAGKRGGFDDTRGTMFFEIARIVREKQPRLLLLENVKGLLSHDKGNTFRTIISTLDELGYDCQWQVLNSKNHGVPQNRERVFIIGHLRGTSRPEVFPFGDSDGEDIRNTGEDLSYCLDANYHKGTNTLAKGRRQLVQIPEATKQGYAEATEGDSINLSVPNSKTRRGRVGKGVETLDTGMQQHTLQNSQIRRLTPTECERLQGFPDGWTEGVSDTQRYKCCGNAVTTNVIRDIIPRLV